MIDRLVQILAQDSELSAEEILDVLWLAATKSAGLQAADTKTDSRAPAGTGPEGHVDELESARESDSANEADNAVPVRGGDEAGQISGTEAEIPLYLGGDAADADDDVSAPVPATEVAFGAPRPIHDPLTLPMALRRLRRIMTPGPDVSVDIDATVEATADAGGRLMTVLTRPPRRALDLALVADGAPSMDIWAGTFDELERLLAQTGAFRSVTRWTLRLSGDAVQLESRDGRAQPPRRLIDPTGRRLVLLATDGRDETWYSAAPWDMLDAWCASMPTALLQVLPQHYWATTAVGDPYLTAIALRPAAPNTQYVRRLAWWADDPGGVPLPVVTLSPQAMETWAQVVAGGTAWATGITAVPPARESAPSADDGADPHMLVNDFRSRASRGAQRLARILASTETLSVPLIEVLQDRLAPETGVLERAEVLASGMLTQNRTADGQALFRYRPGISEILRRGATTFEDWDTYAAVSQYLEDRHRLGGPLRALVADPNGTAELDAAGAPFAALHESLAVRLGLRDPTANQTATSATSGPSESEDPAPGEAEGVLHDEAGNLLLDEAGDVLPSEVVADVHDEPTDATSRRGSERGTTPENRPEDVRLYRPRRSFDPVGPFGNPDGSRADIEDVISEFVDFGGDPAYGHLATQANDSLVRVIVGKLGAGKSVYLRRLHNFQARQDSVYADAPQQNPPKTEVIVKACQWFSGSVLVEKWMQIWERAIMRSLASNVLRHPELRQQVRDEQAEEIEHSYARLLDDFLRPRSIYSQVRDIINRRQTGHQLSAYLDDPLWDDLEDLLGEVIGQCKPIYFYLDGVEEEFNYAPMYWLKCQEGLFYQVMRLLRDHRLGGRLHVVVCIPDIVMSSVYRSEHAPRYYNEPHIRVLTWDRGSLLYLLGQKLQRLPPSLLMRRPGTGPPTIRDWLGIGDDWTGPDGDGPIEDYLLGHTRLIPRDIISLGNELSGEVLRQKQAGHEVMPPEALATVVQRCAKRSGDSQLAQCANQISSDLMPKNAALHNYSELFTSTQAYISGVQEDIRSFVRMIGVDRFSRGDLMALQEMADLHFEKATDLAAVLWQNGLLGYVDESGRRRFYSMGDVEQFHFPPEVGTYVLHPCLAYAVGGIRRVGGDSAGAGDVRHSLPLTSTERGGLKEASGAAPPSDDSQALPEPDSVELRSWAGTVAANYAVGDVLEGRFEILQVLGQGGFSKVYRVRDDVEGEERALKLFDSAAGDEAVRREIGALRKINHPNVMKVFWAGKTSVGEWYLITEFIDGESLDEFITGNRHLRDREAVDVALDLLDALVAFHPDAARLKQLDAKRREDDLSEAESREWMDLKDKGLVHRDIKPLNVMLTRTGAKLLDFNIASRFGEPVHTQSGTPPYQPPDAGLERWDVSTDLFAMGVLLYQLVCNGRHPFPNERPMVDEPVIDPRMIRPDLNPDLAEFLIKACAPASAARFSTAADMRLALRNIRADL